MIAMTTSSSISVKPCRLDPPHRARDSKPTAIMHTGNVLDVFIAYWRIAIGSIIARYGVQYYIKTPNI